MYDPLLDTWTPKAAFPGFEAYYPVAFPLEIKVVDISSFYLNPLKD